MAIAGAVLPLPEESDLVSKNEADGDDALQEILSTGNSAAASATNEEPFDEVYVGHGAHARREESEGDRERLRPELLKGIQLNVRVELGSRSMPLKEALTLDEGSVIDLKRGSDDPVNLYVSDQLLARGVVMVVDDCFCVRITEVLPPS